MHCPHCRFENPEESRFCLKCGKKLDLQCPQCGKVLPPIAEFCNACGRALQAHRQDASADDGPSAQPVAPSERPLPQRDAPAVDGGPFLPHVRVDYARPHSYTPKHLAEKILATRSALEGERKLVTVLFADVANFTGLSERLDPEEVHQIMDGCFRILMDEIHRHEGTINQFTGDGVMALFGAPVAHEDHAQRACHAALAIQRALREYGESIEDRCGAPFKMRIGLNAGPVVVGAIGDDLRMDYTAVGDTTNLAARMQSLAEPGGIWVSGHVHRLVTSYFALEPKGQVAVKGKAEPQEAFALIGTKEVATRLEAAAAKGLTRFVGRGPEMEVLRKAWEKARSGSGQVVGMVGEAGVGKSRLLYELRRALEGEGCLYLEGRCLHYGRSMPYLPFLDVLRGYFKLEEGERESSVKKKILAKVMGLDERLQGILAPLHDILSLEVEDAAYLRMEPKHRRERVFEAIRDLLVRSSQDRPLLLAVEDLHWIDQTSEAFLDYLIGWLAPTRILLLLLYRPEYDHAWGKKSYCTRIGVDQLPLDESAELVQAVLLGGEVAPELRDLILRRAAGNPLFMEELTHTLVENGTIERKEDRLVLVGRDSELQIPDTVQSIIAARIDRLEENLKRTMQVASVIGRDFAYRILHRITGMRQELKSHLLNLQVLEFIYEKSLFPELEYIFKHALTQEVAYQSLLVRRRAEIHERIGLAIEQLYGERLAEFYEMLAYHYSKTERHEKAYTYLRLAGIKATKAHAPREAVRLFQQAGDLLQREPVTDETTKQKLELICLMCTPLMPLGYPMEFLPDLQEGERLARHLGERRSLAGLCGHLSAFHAYHGQSLEGIKYAEESFEQARESQDIEQIARIAPGLCMSYATVGLFRKVAEITPEVIELLERSQKEDNIVARGMNAHAVLCALVGYSLCTMGDITTGMALLKKGLDRAYRLSDARATTACRFWLGLAYYNLGCGEDSRESLEICLEHAKRLKWPSLIAAPLSFLGFTYIMAGDLETARVMIEESLSRQETSGAAWGRAWPYFFLSWLHLELKDNVKASSFAERALAISKKHHERAMEARSWRLLGKALGRTDPSQKTRAIECIQRSIDLCEEAQARPLLAVAFLDLGEVYATSGEKDEALKHIHKAMSMFQEMNMRYFPDKARELLEAL